MEAQSSHPPGAVDASVGPDPDPDSDPDSGPAPPSAPARRRRGAARALWPVVAVVSLGGAAGAAARYGALLIWPPGRDAMPWATLGVNAVGCAVIGVFMVLISEVWTAHRLVRPFFGTGVLGGFTTFSTYAADVERLVSDGAARTGLAYLALTPLVALAAVWSAVAVTRRALAWRQP